MKPIKQIEARLSFTYKSKERCIGSNRVRVTSFKLAPDQAGVNAPPPFNFLVLRRCPIKRATSAVL
jgi:hypothetical protein